MEALTLATAMRHWLDGSQEGYAVAMTQGVGGLKITHRGDRRVTESLTFWRGREGRASLVLRPSSQQWRSPSHSSGREQQLIGGPTLL